MSLFVEMGFNVAVLAQKWGSNLTFRVVETGGTGQTRTITISTGKHFLRTAVASYTKPDPDDAAVTISYAALVTALQTALNAAGLACTYTVTFSTTTQLITITASAGGSGVTSFAIDTISATANRLIGFTTNRSGAMSYAADRAPYFWIKGTQGGISEYFWNEEADPEIGDDLRSHGAEVYGVAQDELPRKFDAIVPLEPKAVLWNDFASSTVPFTWERFVRYGRSRGPILFDLADGSVAKKFLLQLRRDGMTFRPRPRQTRNLWTYGDVPIAAWRLGTAV